MKVAISSRQSSGAKMRRDVKFWTRSSLLSAPPCESLLPVTCALHSPVGNITVLESILSLYGQRFLDVMASEKWKIDPEQCKVRKTVSRDFTCLL